MFCQYKNALGIPKQGVHSYRIFNIAVIDVLLTILLAMFISYLFSLALWKSVLACFVSGILLHRLFCVRTTIDKALFPNVKE